MKNKPCKDEQRRTHSAFAPWHIALAADRKAAHPPYPVTRQQP